MSDPPRNMTLEHLVQAMASLAENTLPKATRPRSS